HGIGRGHPGPARQRGRTGVRGDDWLGLLPLGSSLPAILRVPGRSRDARRRAGRPHPAVWMDGPGHCDFAGPVGTRICSHTKGGRADADAGPVNSMEPVTQRKNSEPIRPTLALDQLDPLLQHRSRLGALVLLAGADALSFSRLKALLSETDGNLGA